jgi:hypothetical protein
MVSAITAAAAATNDVLVFFKCRNTGDKHTNTNPSDIPPHHTESTVSVSMRAMFF